MTKAWIQTYPAGKFFPLDPKPGDVTIISLARALSHMCRFTGQCEKFYSVAEHCVRVSELCCPEHRLAGILHDASEAYIADVSSPVKHDPRFGFYREVEAKLQATIYEAFGVGQIACNCIEIADGLLLATEARDLMSEIHPDWTFDFVPLEGRIEPWSPAEARQRFTERLVELYLEHSARMRAEREKNA